MLQKIVGGEHLKSSEHLQNILQDQQNSVFILFHHCLPNENVC